MTARPFRWVGQAEAQDLVDLSNRPIQILPPDSDDDDDDSDDFDRRNIRLGESRPTGGVVLSAQQNTGFFHRQGDSAVFVQKFSTTLVIGVRIYPQAAEKTLL